MRISDWSSDVCSSDLRHHQGAGEPLYDYHQCSDRGARRRFACMFFVRLLWVHPACEHRGLGGPVYQRRHNYRRCSRSEEHTSELQSLMRISYAVFCLKKKTISNYTLLQPSTHTE